MTVDEATEKAKVSVTGAINMLWDAFVDLLNQSWRALVVVSAALSIIWVYALEGHVRAYAGGLIYDELVKPCVRDEFGNREKTLACQAEESKQQEAEQSQAIESLTDRFDAYVAQQSEIELKRSQDIKTILKLLEAKPHE